jgi:hypothetical protein
MAVQTKCRCIKTAIQGAEKGDRFISTTSCAATKLLPRIARKNSPIDAAEKDVIGWEFSATAV